MTGQVSVVMPVFDGALYLQEAIDSILGQTHEDFELIIADDGSSDASAEIIGRNAALDRRIRPLYLTHRGSGAATNAAIARARGEFIAQMDQDDIALPRRLERQVEWMEATGAGICGSQCEAFGDSQGIWWFPLSRDSILSELLFRVGFLHPTVMARADVMRSNPYNETVLADDYEFFTRVASRHEAANLPDVLLRHRCHARQMHVVHGARYRQDFWRYRFRLFYELFPQTPLSDYLALARVSDGMPVTSLADLDRAGEWLVRLAGPPDRRLRERMFGRWRAACEASSALGGGVESLRERHDNRFCEMIADAQG